MLCYILELTALAALALKGLVSISYSLVCKSRPCRVRSDSKIRVSRFPTPQTLRQTKPHTPKNKATMPKPAGTQAATFQGGALGPGFRVFGL